VGTLRKHHELLATGITIMYHLSEVRSMIIILYVADQGLSRDFFVHILGRQPSLDVPGMTEFELFQGVSLGLMPQDGIARILGSNIPHPKLAAGIPRCELYLPAEDPALMLERLVAAGGREISPAQPRDWGDTVAYGADPDGHIIAFFSKT
jgi:catechol 2,3-dioxygenase-like lactoylglutathione lyase family enzyme